MGKLNKKKKGFTLIELVIVLAVLAIIALIAIPNFTKVRNDSLKKADARTGEQIEKITLMAIADQDVAIPLSGKTYTAKISINATTKKIDVVDGTSGIFPTGNATAETDYEDMLKEVKMPQVNNQDSFQVSINDKGDVEVNYLKGTKVSSITE